MQDNKEEQTWQSLAFIWIGSMISVPGLLLGGTLIAGMSFWTAILTALVGYGVIVIGMIFMPNLTMLGRITYSHQSRIG